MEQDIVVITDSITKKEVEELAKKRFGDMVKGVVDIEKGIMVLGGELHAAEEQVMLDSGSSQNDLWGINIYHAMPREERGNRSRSVEDENIRRKIIDIVNRLIVD